jgi:hypothetical protein
MDGAPRVFGGIGEKQTRVLRLASLAQDDKVFEDERFLGNEGYGLKPVPFKANRTIYTVLVA